jgi:hypothetical protein
VFGQNDACRTVTAGARGACRIAPTIPVHRTIAGIAAGRDEMLEAALVAAGG